MTKNVEVVVIDLFTCSKHKVSPDTYREKLKESALFREADIQVDAHTNSSLGGDYSRSGAVMRITFEGAPGDQDALHDAARDIFNQLKVSG